MKTSLSSTPIILTFVLRVLMGSPLCTNTAHANISISVGDGTVRTSAYVDYGGDDIQQDVLTANPYDLSGNVSSSNRFEIATGSGASASSASVESTFTVPKTGGFLLRASGYSTAFADSSGYKHALLDYYYSGLRASAHGSNAAGHGISINTTQWNYELAVTVNNPRALVSFNGELFRSSLLFGESFYRAGVLSSGGYGIGGSLTVIVNAQSNGGSESAQVQSGEGYWEYNLLLTPVIKAEATVLIDDITHVFDGSPKSVMVTTVPAGLPTEVTYDGLMESPTSAGTYVVVATIKHADYQGSSTATLTIEPAGPIVIKPTISSPLFAIATYAEPFIYTITATNDPTDYDAFILPPNLLVNHTSGVISGTPQVTGYFPVDIAASNAAGSGIAQLALTIEKAVATVNLNSLMQTYDGSPKPVIVTTDPFGLNNTVSYEGSTIVPSAVGSYVVIATIEDSNYEGSASGTLVITSAPQPQTPVQIVTQPLSTTVIAGQPATLEIFADGSEPIGYQWRKNNKDVSGATSATLTIASAQSTDGDRYRVVVSNSVNSVTSVWATLSVLVPPTITQQPVDVTVTAGRNATFTVKATGTTPLSYQWQKDGIDISGATSIRLQLHKVTPADAAGYTIVVGNAGGSVTSAQATLTVQ